MVLYSYSRMKEWRATFKWSPYRLLSNNAFGSSHLNLIAFDRKGLWLSANTGRDTRCAYTKEEETGTGRFLLWKIFPIQRDCLAFDRRKSSIYMTRKCFLNVLFCEPLGFDKNFIPSTQERRKRTQGYIHGPCERAHTRTHACTVLALTEAY